MPPLVIAEDADLQVGIGPPLIERCTWEASMTLQSDTTGVNLGRRCPTNTIVVPEDNDLDVHVETTTSTVGDTIVGLLPGGLTVQRTLGSRILTLNVPEDIEIYGNLSWDGRLRMPKALQTSSVTVNAATVLQVYEIGPSDQDLTFNKAIRIFLEDAGANQLGFQDADGVYRTITTTCSADTQAAGNALPANGDCRIAVGDDAVIWTKHFTKVVISNQNGQETSTTERSSPGGGFSLLRQLQARNTPPIIVRFTAQQKGTRSVHVEWYTNETTHDMLWYGLWDAHKQAPIEETLRTVRDDSYRVGKEVVLKNLAPGENYVFVIRAKDTEGAYSETQQTLQLLSFDDFVKQDIPSKQPQSILANEKITTLPKQTRVLSGTLETPNGPVRVDIPIDNLSQIEEKIPDESIATEIKALAEAARKEERSYHTYIVPREENLQDKKAQTIQPLAHEPALVGQQGDIQENVRIPGFVFASALGVFLLLRILLLLL